MKSQKNITRRNVIVQGIQIPAGAFVALALGACSQEQDGVRTGTCANTGSLTSGELSLRESTQYVEASVDPKKICQACTYFSSIEGSNCGQCQIFSGPVNANGYCTSWNPKQA